MGERVRWVGGEGEVGGGRKTVGHYTIMHTTGRNHLHCETLLLWRLLDRIVLRMSTTTQSPIHHLPSYMPRP